VPTKPPFTPEGVVAEFATLLKTYRVSKVTGDRYGGEWPRERFREHGIRYEPATKPKSDLYRDMLPAINSRQVDLLDDARLVAQIVGLERRTARGGRDSIDHAPGSHDDLCNAVAGVVAELISANSFPGYGVYEYYRREAEKAGAPVEQVKLPPPDFGFNFGRAPATNVVKLKPSDDTSTVYGMTGTTYNKRDGIFEVTEEDAPPLLQRGYQRVG
jgi:hypothetical protein